MFHVFRTTESWVPSVKESFITDLQLVFNQTILWFKSEMAWRWHWTDWADILPIKCKIPVGRHTRSGPDIHSCTTRTYSIPCCYKSCILYYVLYFVEFGEISNHVGRYMFWPRCLQVKAPLLSIPKYIHEVSPISSILFKKNKWIFQVLFICSNC